MRSNLHCMSRWYGESITSTATHQHFCWLISTEFSINLCSVRISSGILYVTNTMATISRRRSSHRIRHCIALGSCVCGLGGDGIKSNEFRLNLPISSTNGSHFGRRSCATDDGNEHLLSKHRTHRARAIQSTLNGQRNERRKKMRREPNTTNSRPKKNETK